MHVASVESNIRKHLLNKSIIHGLISLSLWSCDATIEQKSEKERLLVKEAVNILHNLTFINKSKSSGDKISKRLRKLLTWGGLTNLYYLGKFALDPNIKDFINESGINEDRKSVV